MILRDVRAAGSATFDLVIVGGGIYGATLALESAQRGLKPLLVERDDFGAHTSWNSLRVVHGGLRYLQTADLPRFRESVQERSWFLRCFPDQVRALACLMPLYGHGLRRPGVFRSALAVNDFLSRRRNEGVVPECGLSNGQILGVAETVARFPGVDRRGLKGGALWFDAVMEDSQRVLVEILHWACDAGATCLNYVELTDLILDQASVRGIRARDHATGESLEVQSRVVVNCAGPWSRLLAERLDRDLPKLFRPSLAFNLFLDRRPPFEAAVAVAPAYHGARTYFLLPWKGGTLAGTCHAPWHAGPDQPAPTEEQLEWFLSDLGAAVPGFEPRRTDVARIHAGLLPARAAGTTRLSNRAIIHDHGSSGGPSGFYSVSGVKFTTARLVAERMLRGIFGERARVRGLRRPPVGPVPGAGEILSEVSGSGAALNRWADRLAAEEAVLFLEDLLLRRTDWGYRPDDAARIGARLTGYPLHQHPATLQTPSPFPAQGQT